MRILLLGNPKKESVVSIGNDIAFFLSAHGHECVTEPCLREIGVKAEKRNGERIDFAIVLGGDGTMLRKSHEYEDEEFPYLLVNLGRVGVLADADPTDYLEVIGKVLDGDYFVEKRASLDCELKGKSGKKAKVLAYNEVVLSRGEGLKMLNIGITINNGNETHFFADGLIVATPTGSSAYCLSGGGPLLIPTSRNLVITPLCPQLRTITSLVVSGEDEIEISPELGDKTKKPHLEIDGLTSLQIEEDDTIFLKASSKTLDIIKTKKNLSLFEPIFKVTNTFR